LKDFTGTVSSGWQQETVNLSAYCGQTVQLVWDYVGVSFSGGLYGWTIDDIGITNFTVSGTGSFGTIVISKNLGQGSYSLTGPMNQSGSSTLTTISNAPVGQYTISFDDVAFYITPPPQSNTLAASSTLVFSGDYTFPDTNHNGMSDLWEQYYFGNVSTNRTTTTDTDHDGMSDYAEFIAGTNPNDATSKLVFFPSKIHTNGVVTLQWPAVPGRIYQVDFSTNLVKWVPMTGWMPATGSPMTFTVTNNTRGAFMYRLEVRP
jgi:hypothetical protein